jgi:hypothetical protein
MAGIVEKLHFQATLPGMRQGFRHTIEYTAVPAAGDTPFQFESEVAVLLPSDEVDTRSLCHGAERIALADPTAFRKGVALIASPGFSR